MNTLLGFFAGPPGHTEIILIVLVIILLFGAKKLPELSRSIGKSISEFKKGRQEGLIAEGEEKDDEKLDKGKKEA